VLATLELAPPPTLYVFAAGLTLADRPVSLFAQPINYLAASLEQGGSADRLANLAMRHALREAAAEGSLISKLADAETAFWRSVSDALAVVAADLLPA
jgi:hypothetical protein